MGLVSLTHGRRRSSLTGSLSESKMKLSIPLFISLSARMKTATASSDVTPPRASAQLLRLDSVGDKATAEVPV